jgi:hypothetical protein
MMKFTSETISIEYGPLCRSAACMIMEDAMPEKFNSRLNAAFLKAVENQLRDNQPPEARQTYERLLREGHSEAETKDLIGAAIASETYYILKRNEPFNRDRYVKTLNNLPNLPE